MTECSTMATKRTSTTARPSSFCTVIYLLLATSLVMLQTVCGAVPKSSSSATDLPATPNNNDMVNNMQQSEWMPVTTTTTGQQHSRHPNNNNVNNQRRRGMHAAAIAAADSTTTTGGGGGPTTVGEYVATTPKIDISSTKAPSRYELGLEDYEEAVDRVEKEKEAQRSNDALTNTFSLFSVLNQAWNKVNTGAPDSTSSSSRSMSENVAPSQDRVDSTDASEGRYIKGDPLKGYYDFIITEGSYKFWAVFQLATALLMIYSTFAAIYYSKVNPIVSDYDYVSYLGGRSLADDPEPVGPHPAASLLNSGWMQTAAHSFEFVLNAIDRLPAQK